MSDQSPAGWQPDPTGRFARRYFDGSDWTDHVANVPGETLNDPFVVPPPPEASWEQAPPPVLAKNAGSDSGGSSGSRLGKRRLVMGLVLIAALVAGVIAILTRDTGPGDDEVFLAALEDAGLTDEFPSESAALRSAARYCEDLDAGDVDPVGSEAELLATETYCPEYSGDFRVLDTRTFTGTFSVSDSEYVLDTSGDPCTGEGGYSDIRAGTQVRVVDVEGTLLTTADLEGGEVRSGDCVFDFEVELTEGQDQYVFEVGDRGELVFEWDELDTDLGFVLG